MRKFLLSLVLPLTLAACATAPESLVKTERREKIVLPERISTVAFRGLNVRCEEGALAGVYTASREDAQGVYFDGPGRSIWNTNEVLQKKPRFLVGGIYMPKDRSRAPQFFYVIESDVHTADNVDAYVQQRITASPAGTPGVGMGANVAGNVIGGAIVQAAIAADLGKISKFPPIEDPLVRQKILRSLKKLR